MRKCLLIPSSTASLLPVNTVCRKLQLGCDIQPGGIAARFYNSGGETMQQLKQNGDLYKIPIEVDSGYESCEEGTYNDYEHETGL